MSQFDEDPRLTELEIDVVTITRDGDGLVTVEGGGLSSETVSHLLLVGQFVHAESQFAATDDPDPDDEG